MLKTLCSFGAAAIVAPVILSGCGGSSRSSRAPWVQSVTHQGTEFFWVRGSAAVGNGPEASISASSNAPAGSLAPATVAVTIAVNDGAITPAPVAKTFEVASGNQILAVVQANTPTSAGQFNMMIPATGLELNGHARTLASLALNRGSLKDDGEPLAVEIGTPPDRP